MGNPVGDDTRLSRSGSSENQKALPFIRDGFPLLGIESAEVDHGWVEKTGIFGGSTQYTVDRIQ
jgi:hypothetical protein